MNDIVGDFSQLIGARVSSRFRSNETPSTEVLAAVVVDAVRRGGVRNYNDFLARMGGAENISKQATGLPDLNSILPNPETMAQALKEYAQDAEDMNRLFAEFGEKPFKDGSDALRNHQVDHWKMFQLLLRVLSAGIDRQERLETRLGTLAAELEDLKSLVGKG